MKFLVNTDEPLVLEKIKLNKRVSIRFIEDDDGYGEEMPFEFTETDYMLIAECPKCGRRFGTAKSEGAVKFCPWCGVKNGGVA